MARYRIELCHGTAPENQVIDSRNLTRPNRFEVRKVRGGSGDLLHFGGENHSIKTMAEKLGVPSNDIASLVSHLSSTAGMYRGHCLLEFAENAVTVQQLGQQPSRVATGPVGSDRIAFGQMRRISLDAGDVFRVLFSAPTQGLSPKLLFLRVTRLGEKTEESSSAR